MPLLIPGDTLSPSDILAANPGGIPQAVNTVGGVPFNITVPPNSFPGATLTTGAGGQVLSAPGAGNSMPASSAGSTATAPIAQASVAPPAPAANAPAPGSIADYFSRAIIVVLGFIFVAVGLNMLRPGTVPIGKPKI
jgi:hypothetical protein